MTPGTLVLRILPLIAAASYSAPAAAAPDGTVMVEMRDAVKLATDFYVPSGAGPFPAVLIRTPYGKSAMDSIGDGLRGVGIATIVQDLRGRFASEGTDCVFRCDGDGDLKDGYDTMAWLATLPAFDGHLVTWGGSALGIVQYMAASATPPALDAMWVAVGTPSVYEHAFYQGGAFRKELMENWLQGQGSSFFLQEVKDHPAGDPFWNAVQTAPDFGDVKVPAVHEGGWYDIFAQGTIDAFVGYQHQGGDGAKGKQKLILGPWTHGGMRGTHQGQLDYPANAVDPPQKFENLLSLWLSHHLGMSPDQAAIDAIPPVIYYVMGDVTDAAAPGNVWRSASDWPIPASPARWYLHPGNSLGPTCPPGGAEFVEYTYDPASPCPTLGGANLTIPAGPMDQSPVEQRPDVVLWSSESLSQPVEVTGRIRAHLFVSIDTPDTDLHVRLTDVYPDQRSMLVLDGALRLATRGGFASEVPMTPGQIVEAVVDLWSTSIVFNKGHRIRLSVTSSNTPRFFPNPNDGTRYGQSSVPQPVHVKIHHSAEYPSYVELPDPSMGPVETCGMDAGALDSGGGGSAGSAGAGEGGSGAPDAATDASSAGSGVAGAGASGGEASGSWDDDSDSGCGCRMARSPAVNPWTWALAAAALLRAKERHTRRKSGRPGL